MASLQTIEAVQPHPNADRLDLAEVIGTTCIVARGEFKAGERVVFIMPDHCLPSTPENDASGGDWAAGFRAHAAPRVRAIKLRGVLSEGLCVALPKVAALLPPADELATMPDGTDVSDRLGVTKYESAEHGTHGTGLLRPRGPGLPLGIARTDEPRWNTVRHKLPWGERVTVTLKIDGQSASFGLEPAVHVLDGASGVKRDRAPGATDESVVESETSDAPSRDAERELSSMIGFEQLMNKIASVKAEMCALPETGADEQRARLEALHQTLRREANVLHGALGASGPLFHSPENKGTSEMRLFVTSRSVNLKPDDDNRYTEVLRKYQIEEKLRAYCAEHKLDASCFRGESYGPGIQSLKHNPHCKVKERVNWAMFHNYDVENRRNYPRGHPLFFLPVAQALDLPHVPVLEDDVELTPELVRKYAETLEKLPGTGQPFEGVVIHHAHGSFKVINKHYDAKK